MDILTTDIWEQYEKGVEYNRKKEIYKDTEDNYNFYHGKQWNNAELGDMQEITINVVKPIVKYKLGIINTNQYQVVFNPNNYEQKEFQEQMKELCKHLNKHTTRVWEQEQVDRKIREAVKDSCINSEGIVYCYNTENEDLKNEIKIEVIDKTNIYYGNENSDDIQSQPYIIISFRKPVDDVRAEAESNGISKEEIKKIVSDDEVDEQSGNDGEEITPMCLVLLKLYKKNGLVHSMKSTRTVIIQEETDHKLKLYPVAHMTWEDVKGSSRGIGEVSPIKANQIEINKTAMRRAIAVKIGAYPKLVANVEHIKNPDSLSQVGTTVKLSGQTVDDINKNVGYLRPATMSSDSEKLQLELITNTRELSGAGDVATGQVNPEQASGKAILAVQQASQQPLNEQLNKYKVFIEDIARIWFDLWRAYETNGMTILVSQYVNEQEVEQPYTIPYTVLEKLRVNISIDITPKSPFDKYAQEMSLENLLMKGLIQFEEYVSALDDDSAMPKPKLVEILKKRKEAQAQIEQMQQAVQQNQLAMQKQLQIQGIQDQVNGGYLDEMSKMQNGGNVSTPN